MTSEISFLLDFKPVTLNLAVGAYSPTTTVLNYLRNLPDHKGVKEGCAEGDCGACTVVLAEAGSGGKLDYKAVDSCLIFLPMIHGKQLITVESLRGPDGSLHPVQKAMVEEHGAQCGFCTPGIIMSMFALYKNHKNPSREVVEDALTGNLCRCTGYRPIIDAAMKACDGKPDHFSGRESQIAGLLDKIPKHSLTIKTGKQSYFRPATLPEALLLKAEHPKAVLVSGATDAALRVTKKHEIIPEIIDLSAVTELKEVSGGDDHLIIGAGLPLSEVHAVAGKVLPALNAMLSVYGSLQIRHMGTIGGSLGTASPIGDMLPVLMAYGGKIIMESIHGKRKVDFNAYLTGYRQTVRTDDEIITAVKIRKPGKETIVRSFKVSKRKDLDISTVSAGFRLTLDSQNIVRDIALVYGGMAEMTKHAVKTEEFLAGNKWERPVVEQAMAVLDNEFTPISDARSGADYRRIAAKNLLLKFWSETIGSF